MREKGGGGRKGERARYNSRRVEGWEKLVTSFHLREVMQPSYMYDFKVGVQDTTHVS